ncbi:DUF7927 domain-containing protein [Tenggerimyces flavus]|uniref:DUF6923 family protein n=1 Tax=Tenggerimyces flavus TaxID=1708749 RepID=A0ABV7YC64_9ACTN|nr:DUF11 domain-containing protein [Tenggerimyces flavus]MBM7785681.1 putative repeat protein (TIGR01451 family) [Tenggerimyces flavus]
MSFTNPISRRLLRAGSAMAVIAAVGFAGAAPAQAIAQSIAQTKPKAAAPADPKVLFTEDFENTGTDPVRLDAYQGKSHGYVADPAWLQGCNGWVASWQAPADAAAPVADCGAANWWNLSRGLSYSLGALHQKAETNHGVSAYTYGNPGADKVQFETKQPIALPTKGRFVTFSVDAAENSCHALHAALKFYLVDGAQSIPTFTTPIDPCTDPNAKIVPSPANSVDSGPTATRAGTYAGNKAVLFDGDQLGIRLVNGQGSGGGNDAAFDNIRVLDVTPKLAKAFAPANVDVGETSRLTFTVTNTSELAEKADWTFTDTLPEGLDIAGDGGFTSTCAPFSFSLDHTGGVLTMTGTLAAGQETCEASVNVVSKSPGTYENCAKNLALTGLDAPECATLEVVAPPTFPCEVSTVFLSQGIPTGLKAQEYSAGGSDFVPVGPASDWRYNAIGVNPKDGYIYGMSTGPEGGHQPGRLLRIDATGKVTSLGAPQGDAELAANGSIVGAFDDDGTYYSIVANHLTKVDVTTTPAAAQVVGPVAGWTPADFAYADGFFWGQSRVGTVTTLYRLNPADASVVTFTSPVQNAPENGQYGAAWRYGNGNLGFSANVTGNNHQIAVANPGSANPTFTLVSTVPGPVPGQNNNDGTGCISKPADLAIEKSAPSAVDPSGEVRWTLKVTNNGAGIASGFTVTDQLPAEVTELSTPTVGAKIDDHTLTYNGGRLEVGDSVEIVVVGKAPATYETCFSNSASVTGNENDPNPDNDKASVKTCTGGEPAYTLTKTSSAADGAVKAGDKVVYTLTVTNTGKAEVTPTVTDDLSGTLDDASYNGDAAASDGPAPTVSEPTLTWSGPVPVGGTVTITYSVTVKPTAEQGDHVLKNAASGDGPIQDCPAKPCATTTNPVASYTLAKTADPAAGTAVEADQKITYTLTVTNTGGAPVTPTVTDDLTDVLDDASYNGDAAASDGSVPSVSETTLTWTGAVPVGGTVTITYSVTVLAFDAQGDHTLANAASGDGPIDGCEATPCVSTENPSGGYTIAKSVDPESGTAVSGGDVLTYTVEVQNVGAAPLTPTVTDDLSAVLDDATYNGDASASSGPAPTVSGSTLTWSGPLPVGATVTITYSVKVLAFSEQGDHLLKNVASGDGPVSGCKTAPCATTENSSGGYTLSKSADPASGESVADGQKVTYRVLVANKGAAPVSPVVTDDLSGVLDDATYNGDAAASDGSAVAVSGSTLTWSGTVPAGKTVTITYSVTVLSYDDQHDHKLGNVVSGDGPLQGCEAGKPCARTDNPAANPPVGARLPKTGGELLLVGGGASLLLILGLLGLVAATRAGRMRASR